MPDGLRKLCRVTDVPEDGAKGFPGADGGSAGLIVVRQGDQVHVYENACPHTGTPLDWTPGQFMSVDGRYLICATHGAQFTIATGKCISGPCRGDRLTHVDVVIDHGVIYLSPSH